MQSKSWYLSFALVNLPRYGTRTFVMHSKSTGMSSFPLDPLFQKALLSLSWDFELKSNAPQRTYPAFPCWLDQCQVFVSLNSFVIKSTCCGLHIIQYHCNAEKSNDGCREARVRRRKEGLRRGVLILAQTCRTLPTRQPYDGKTKKTMQYFPRHSRAWLRRFTDF